jgi:hypothetical protein
MHWPASLAAASAAWLANPWLLWGAGPMAAVAAGFFATAGLLEGLIATGWFDSAMVVYPTAGAQKTRADGVEEVHVRGTGPARGARERGR